MRRKAAMATLLRGLLLAASAHARRDRRAALRGRTRAQRSGLAGQPDPRHAGTASSPPKAKPPQPPSTSIASARCSPRAANGRPGWPPRSRRSERHLEAERARLRRARRDLARRLVAIYESGSPSTASVVLASSSFEELAHALRISATDRGLRHRAWRRGCRQVRNRVRHELKLVAALKARVRRLRRAASPPPARKSPAWRAEAGSGRRAARRPLAERSRRWPSSNRRSVTG